MARPVVHAVYLLLNELDLFAASLASIYDSIDVATVVTAYDRDRFGNPVQPEGVVEALLSRQLDPDRKVQLIVTTEGSQPERRNRAMAYGARGGTVIRRRGEPDSLPAPDLYWHVDADEIYDPAELPRLFDYLAAHRAPAYRLEWRTYFKSWNWMIDGAPTFLAFTRPGFRFGDIRDPYPTVWRRGAAKLGRAGIVPARVAQRLGGVLHVPGSVAVCHHGSYVGERDRIAAKFRRAGHRDEYAPDWMERVWDRWTPEMRDLHPSIPELFPIARHVPTDELPSTIREHPWPTTWLERSPA